MKKIITAVLACGFAYSYAQITLTKDLSFGNNGIAEIGTENFSVRQLYVNNAPTFLGDKLFLTQPIYNSSENFIGRKYFRLNNNGTLDSTFGVNGEVSISTTNEYDSESFYADTNQFYLITGEKYISNGQLDIGFGNINTGLTTGYHHYQIVLPDGKILSRNQQSISKYLSNGTPDTSFGNNGFQTVASSLENGMYSFGEFLYYNDNFLYEIVYTVGVFSKVRKININTGTLDLTYGQNGYSDIFGTTGSPNMSFDGSSSPVPQSTASFIHNFPVAGGAGHYTRTNSSGNYDISFGANGSFDYVNSYTLNGNYYDNAQSKPMVYGNYILQLATSYDNGTNERKFAVSGYDFSGNTVTINSNLQYALLGIISNASDYYIPLIKDNYLYIFFGNNIARYIISESTLSVSENVDKNDVVHFTNPFGNELLLNTNEKIKSIDIYDESGRIVLRNKSSKNIDTSALNKGVYIIKITTESNQVISKKGIRN